MPREEIFAHTGIQFMQINTLYQLYAMRLAGSPALASARTLLMMPDLFNYWLTGVAQSELTIASTSQFYNPREKRWATELFEKLGLPASILPEIVAPGTRSDPGAVGRRGRRPGGGAGLRHRAATIRRRRWPRFRPRGDDWCYISSGTWSLMGVELDEPVINDAVAGRELDERNRRGGQSAVAEEYRRAVAAAGMPAGVGAGGIGVSAMRNWRGRRRSETVSRRLSIPMRFWNRAICPGESRSTARPPDSGARPVPAEVARTILESLALRYREVLEMIEGAARRRFAVIHIVGGGSHNQVLNQFVADATGRTVIAGPAEATAIGNVLIQAIGSGELADLDEARAVVRRSFPTRVIEPAPAADWDRAYQRYRDLPA